MNIDICIFCAKSLAMPIEWLPKDVKIGLNWFLSRIKTGEEANIQQNQVLQVVGTLSRAHWHSWILPYWLSNSDTFVLLLHRTNRCYHIRSRSANSSEIMTIVNPYDFQILKNILNAVPKLLIYIFTSRINWRLNTMETNLPGLGWLDLLAVLKAFPSWTSWPDARRISESLTTRQPVKWWTPCRWT